jgi:hypothetical protein
MTTGFHIDTGARCDRHVGEVFPPRCADCDALQDEEGMHSPRTPEPLPPGTPACGYFPGSHCPRHFDHPEPCRKCQREGFTPATPDTDGGTMTTEKIQEETAPALSRPRPRTFEDRLRDLQELGYPTEDGGYTP